MPQFDQIGEIYASQLFWLAIFFGAMFFIVGRGMLPRIVSTVDARNQRIEDDLKVADQARDRAASLEEDYRQEMDRARSAAAGVSAEAKAKAAVATEALLRQTDEANDVQIAAALIKIAEARAVASDQIETIAAEAAEAMVERVAGLRAQPGRAIEAVKQEMVNG